MCFELGPGGFVEGPFEGVADQLDDLVAADCLARLGTMSHSAHHAPGDGTAARRVASEISHAAFTSPMWLNACGKLPSSSPVAGSTSSASRPTSLANATAR